VDFQEPGYCGLLTKLRLDSQLEQGFFTTSAHTASYLNYPAGNEGLFPRVKRPENEANHSPTCNGVIKYPWSHTFTQSFDPTAQCFVNYRDEFTL